MSRLSGWCSGPYGCDSGRAHQICEDRCQRGYTNCDCPDHNNEKEEAG